MFLNTLEKYILNGTEGTYETKATYFDNMCLSKGNEYIQQ